MTSGTYARVSAWSGALLICSALYVFLYDGFAEPFLSISRVTAATSAFLLGASLGMNSFAYYAGFPSLSRGYQKLSGLFGYALALAYSLMLLFLDPAGYFYGLPAHLFSADVFLGLVSMAIFTLMMLVSLGGIAARLGPERVRLVLGFGFLAFALLVMRAVLLEWDIWAYWARTGTTIPPPRIALSLFALVVLALRLSVPIHRALISRREAVDSAH